MKITSLAIFFFSFNVFSSVFLDGYWKGSGNIITKSTFGDINKACPSVIVDISHDENLINILKGQFSCEGSISKSFNPIKLDVDERGDVFYQMNKVGEVSITELYISVMNPVSSGETTLSAQLNDRNQLILIQKEESFFGSELITKATLEPAAAPK